MRKLTYIVISKTFVQVRALQRPPPGVKLVIDAVCIIKGVKPKKVAGEKVVLYYILNKKSITRNSGHALDHNHMR